MFRVRYILLSFILVASVSAEFSPEERVRALSHVTECIKQWQVSFETVAEALYGDGPFPSAENFKEFLVCSAKKSGTMDQNGNINMDVAKKNLKKALRDPKDTDRLFNTCVTQLDTPQETAHHVYGCLRAEGVTI